MVRRSGNVTNAPRDMLFNLTGKLTLRFVALGNTDVIVAPSSPGMIYYTMLYRFILRIWVISK